MKQHRLAIIGTGQSVGNHLRAIAEVGERVELAAAVDLDEARVKSVCAENNIPHAYSNTTDMLNAIQPDLVHIITPPATHADLITQCLQAGAWVFCEKPLCGSLAEFDKIQQAEAASTGYVSTVFQWRYGSAARHLRKLMQQGELGNPLVGVCHTLWYRTPAYYQVPWRGHWETEFGGPSVTLGIHLMDLFLWLMGDWQEVQAMIGTLDRDIEVEDVSMVHVRFENGAMSSVVNSALSPRQESYIRLDFQHATVEVSALYRASNEHWRYSIADGSPFADQLEKWKTIPQDQPGNHAVQLHEILDCMEAGTRPHVTGDEARRIIEFLSSLYKSAATNQLVRRGSIDADDPFYLSLSGHASIPERT